MINPLAGSFDEKLIKDLKLWLHVLGLLSALQFRLPLPNWLRLGLKLSWQGKGRIVRLFPGWPQFYYATKICECIRLPVCDRLVCTSTFSSPRFPLLFFFFFQPAIVDFVNCERCIYILFTVPQITLFSNFFIKNGSHNTIYTFKNYFATMFSVSVFSFSKNKLNPNTPFVSRTRYAIPLL